MEEDSLLQKQPVQEEDCELDEEVKQGDIKVPKAVLVHTSDTAAK